ncbi:MAG TPA: 4a-hydroxytetrahydrobiopterin dehydratase [Nitrososphaerales archaeon]|nr:4a-hydroxytetrahydrobiopterin dehydratase [Nitrososphaerales archaeon]
MSEEYRKLSRNEINAELPKVKGWSIERGKLHREIKFASFEDAMSFMVRASLEVAKLDHHPEWFNVYNTVKIDLVTHDVDGISNYDFKLALILNRILSNYKVKR